MDINSPSTHEKALQINIDNTKHGTFAEIGAGQEVCRWFFRVGGAAGTVAKTISAYNVAISDAIYGPCQRYVSRERLQSMLQYEYDLLLERLAAERGATTQFFSFANTVATHSYSNRKDGHGWMGIRFQHAAGAPASEIILHVRLLDHENAREQEAIGIMGVNLIFGALFRYNDARGLIASLLDDLNLARVEVDMIRFDGPCFVSVDNRLMSLQLVEQGYTDATMFTAEGEVAQPADVLYKKPILIERGGFRPITKLTASLVENARDQFIKDYSQTDSEPPVVVLEMTLRQLQTGDRIDHPDFLARVDTLRALGHTVMISNYLRYHRLVPFLRRLTTKPIGFAMGLRNVRELFDERFYTDVPGGIFQALGQLLQGPTRLFVCPAIDPETKKIVRPEDFQTKPHLRHLYAHLLENGYVATIPIDETLLTILSRDVSDKIKKGDPSWETTVPAPAVALIKQRGYFGYRGPA